MREPDDATCRARRLGSPGVRNLVFGPGTDRAWSVYHLWPDRPREDPDTCARTHALSFVTLQAAVGPRLLLLRLAQRWSVDDYAIGLEAMADIRHADRGVLGRYVSVQRTALEGLAAHTVSLFLCVGLPDNLRQTSGPEPRRALIVAEEVLFHRLRKCVDAERASEEAVRTILNIGLESGNSPSVVLGLDALPPVVETLDGALAWVFERLEAVEFPVHAALRTYHGEREGLVGSAPRSEIVVMPPRGPNAYRRIQTGRASLRLAVTAPNEAELARWVVELRRELGGARMSRRELVPRGLFAVHTEGRGETTVSFPLARLGALKPGRVVGSRGGPYIGYTVGGTPSPVVFDPHERAPSNRPAGVLLHGAHGAGKTLCAELMAYHAFISGSAVVDIDLTGDHALERLPETADHVDLLELSATRRYRGLLDPMRVAPPALRELLTVDYLMALLPQAVSPQWEREISAAVRFILSGSGDTCRDVIGRLREQSPGATTVADAIEARASAGPAGLGLGELEREHVDLDRSRIVGLRLRDLRPPACRPAPGGSSDEQRIGRAIMKLLVAYALGLASRWREGRCVIAIDDATLLLDDRVGRKLLDLMTRHGGSDGITPLIVTHAGDHASWLRRRLGTVICFRVQDGPEALRAARLLGLGGPGHRLVRGLIEAGPGRCVMRDCEGRVDAVQIDFADDRLRTALYAAVACSP